jgi:hypothetical protein
MIGYAENQQTALNKDGRRQSAKKIVWFRDGLIAL